MKKKISPTAKEGKGNRHHDRRPLARNKTMYNRVIKSIITHKLEDCLKSETKLVILGELLTNTVYSTKRGNVSSLARIDGMLCMLRKYTKKIIEDCRIFKLVPSAEFEPPESLSLSMTQEQIISQLEKRRQDIFQITPQGREWINLSSDILEQVAENVYKYKVSQDVNADKYSRVLHWATCWAEDQRKDTMRKFLGKTEKTENNDVNDEETLQDMSNDFEMINHVTQSPSQTTSKQQSHLVLNISHEEELKSELPEEVVAPEPINKNRLSIQERIKSPYRTKLMHTSSPSGLVTDSSSSNGFNEDMANEKMVKIMMLMKKRDLSTREYDQKIYEVLERYRNSRVGQRRKENPAVV